MDGEERYVRAFRHVFPKSLFSYTAVNFQTLNALVVFAIEGHARRPECKPFARPVPLEVDRTISNSPD